jgi:LysM repeat protein
MSALTDKYSQVINMAKQLGVNDLQVREEGNMLFVEGTAPSEDAKQRIWDVYNTINPNYQSADMALNIKGGGQEYVVKSGDSLSKIGQQFGVSWKEIYEANTDVVKNPDMIQPGWKLKIPQK